MKRRPIQQEDREILSQYALDASVLIDCQLSTFDAGETIFHQDRPMDCLYLVVRGTAKICTNARNGKNLILCYYVSQEILGDIELALGNYQAASTAIAVSEFSCIGIPFVQNCAYLKQNIDFMNIISRSLSTKLLASSNSYTAAALHTSEERLCSYILLSEHNGRFTDVLVDVAQSVGMSYRHIFRIINKLCKEGIMEKTEGGFRILNRELLKKKSLG